MNPKEFIEKVFIIETGDIVNKHPFISFHVVSSGIEFLGKCIDIKNPKWDWDIKYQKENQPFDNAIKQLFPRKYISLFEKDFNLREELRNGFSHFFAPKAKIGLFSKNDLISKNITYDMHPFKTQRGQIYLSAEYFYYDFVEACKKVIKMDFPIGDKMNKKFINIP